MSRLPGFSRLPVWAVLTVSVVGLAACSSDKPAASTGTSAQTHHEATRWWSDGAGAEGSKIDVDNPTSAAAKLTPDAKTYCAVLASTAPNGKSPLSGFSANDPGSSVQLKAWIAELTALAPTDITAAWRTFGGAIISLQEAAAKPSPAFPSYSAADAAAQKSAQQSIDTQTKKDCNLSIFGDASPSAAPAS